MSPQPEEDDDERELSGSEDDDVFDEDMEALRRACMISGTDPDDLDNDAAAAAAGGSNSDDEENGNDNDNDEEDEDLGLLRKIRNRFSSPSDASEPLWMKPLSSLPPAMSDDEEDDDFETLRAIQKRFAAYDNDALKNSLENTEKQEQVDASCMSLQKKSSSDSFVDTFDVCKGLLDSEYVCQTTRHLGDLWEEQPSTSIEWHRTDSSKPSTLQPSYSSFPQSAKVFMDAIKKNRSFQKLLRSKLIQIEAKIEENKKLKERVKILKDFEVSCKRRTGRALSQKKDSCVQLISAKKSSPSKDSKVHDKKLPAMNYGPIENSHVANYRMALTKLPLSLERKKWSDEEKKNLEKGIRQQFQEMALQIMMDQLSGTEESYGDLNDLDNILLSVKDLNITPENIREFLPKVNWEQLASMYVAGRSGAECEARWLNFEDPLINHNPWTAQEDKNLLFLVQKKGISNWFDVAVSLGTNRTPFLCLARYQRSLNVSILKREWTKDEDAKLRAAVEAYGEGDWQSVASALEGWTGTQCSNRWKKSLHPTRERVGRWTADEDKRLTVAQMLFGPRNWKKTAQFVPGRTEVQCRERWVNSLDPSLNWDKWTAEEDSKLIAAAQEHNHCWSKVAEALPRRTDNMCRRRWKKLKPHDVCMLQAAKKMKKAALICNFVDRESERPALGPNDFCPLPMMITYTEKVDHSEKPTGKLRGRKSGKIRVKPFCQVGNKRFKESTENAPTGTEEGFAINNHDEVEIFDGREPTPGQGSENNNLSLTRPGQNHPLSPLLSSENGKVLAGPDSNRTKRPCKPHSTRRELTEPDEGTECLPLQPESLNIISNSDGFESLSLAEANTTLTRTRRVSKQKYSRNTRTTNLEEPRKTTVSSQNALLTGPTTNVERQHNGSSCMDAMQIPVTNDEVIITLGGNEETASKKKTSTKQNHKRKKGSEPDGILEDVVPVPSQDNELKKAKPRGRKRKKGSEQDGVLEDVVPVPSQDNELKKAKPRGHKSKKSSELDGVLEDVVPVPSQDNKLKKAKPRGRKSKKGSEPDGVLEDVVPVPSQDNELKKAKPRGCKRKKGSEQDGVLEDVVPVPSQDNELKKVKPRGRKRKKGSELDGVLEDVVPVPSQDNEMEKVRPRGRKTDEGGEPDGVLEDVVPVASQDNELKKVKHRGTSCLDQNSGTADDDIPLVCFLSKKPKRRELQVNDCQNMEVLPPSIAQKELELFPEGVNTLHNGNSMLSAMQDDELPCYDGGTSVKSGLLTEEYTVGHTSVKSGRENLVVGQKVACEELVEEKVNGHETDDISLASFAQKESKKECRASEIGPPACPPSSLIRGSQLLSKRVNQLHDRDYTSAVPSGLDQITGPEVAFEKRERALADDDFGDTTLSCFLRNKLKMRQLQST